MKNNKTEKNEVAGYLKEKVRAHERNLKYDFMPSIIEIIEKPANIWGYVIISGLFVILLSGILWASVAKLDIVVNSSGMTIPEGNINVVQSYTTGIVKNINVKSGDYVEAGTVIANLSTDETNVDKSSLEQQLDKTKQMYDTDIQLYEGTDADDIVIDWDSSYAYELQYLITKENMYQSQIKIASGTQKDYLKAQRDAALLEEIQNLSAKKEEIQAQLDKITINENYLSILASTDGYINELNINTPGQTVTASQQIATIVPTDTEIIFRGYVKTQDISDLKLSQEVNVKLEAYPYSDYGMVKGEIINISPSTVALENIGNVYVIEVSIKNDNDNIHIISGMNGIAEIKLGKRSVLQYFLDPVTEGLHNSLKEK